jgi:hypothetical protein
MCCLGFLALACGQTEDEILHVAYPSANKTPKMPEWSHNLKGTLGEVLAIANDLPRDRKSEHPATNGLVFATERDREKFIARMFAQAGVEVEFVG